MIGLIANIECNPINEAQISGADQPETMEKSIIPEDEPIFDLMPSEFGLKFVEKKVEKWLKKCYEKGGCYGNLFEYIH